jgi:hypothetical protein
MRSKVAATIALAIALAATTASAGVVISQDLVVSNQAGETKGEQTVMLQGNKQKVISPGRETITDLDAGKMYLINPTAKVYAEIVVPPRGIFSQIEARDGVSIDYKKSGGTHKVAGYNCQDYAGSTRFGHNTIDATECVASDAAGAKEYVGFRKTLAKKLKGTPLEAKGEIPDGIPVSSTITTALIPFPIPPGFPPDQVAKIKELVAKTKPEVRTATVTKIQVKDIAANEFVVPAEYKKQAVQPPPMPLRLKLGAPPAAAPAAAPALTPAAH